MDNQELRRVLAHNIRRLMDSSPGLDTQMTIARKSGIAQSHISKLLRCEASASTDLIAALARAFGVQPWEMLADAEATRKAALEKMILGPRIADDRAAEKLPPAPSKEVALRRRKKGGGNEAPH